MIHHTDEAKSVVDFLSVGLALGTVAEILPQVAAVLSIAWTLLRIGEWVYQKVKK